MIVLADSTTATVIEMYGYNDGGWTDRREGCRPDYIQCTDNCYSS